jgi:hypothetical protein
LMIRKKLAIVVIAIVGVVGILAQPAFTFQVRPILHGRANEFR